MAVPFAMRWEVASFPWNIGSFVEGARVRALGQQEPGDWWVERLHPSLKPAHRERVLRRWFLASQLTSSAWPMVFDAGDDGDRPWVVLESMGHRADGTFPFADPRVALREVHSVALALAEAEALLARRFTRPALALRANLLTRTASGRLMLHLAALDQVVDEGFPTSPGLFMFTPEELLGHPTSARTNAFLLGWLLCLTLTGRAPYEVNMGSVSGSATAEGEAGLREALRPLILQGKVRPLGLPESLRAADVLIRRALAPLPGARFPSAAAFAEALAPLAPPVAQRMRKGPYVGVDEPVVHPGDECLPPSLEASLAAHPEDRRGWLDLARQLDEVTSGASVRAAFIRAQATLEASESTADRALADGDISSALNTPGVVPALDGEALQPSWRFGYVRALSTKNTGEFVVEEKVNAIVGLLQHPSLRFVQELSLVGTPAHAKAWIAALQRHPLAALKRVSVEAVLATDPWATDLAYRYPKLTWTWGSGGAGKYTSGVSGVFRRLLGLQTPTGES